MTYPATAPEIELPELDGKTAKMYRGGKICLTIHFKPLWAKNQPHFGIAHALCLGLAPWMAAEACHPDAAARMPDVAVHSPALLCGCNFPVRGAGATPSGYGGYSPQGGAGIG